jgi:putative heme iron utilization protein
MPHVLDDRANPVFLISTMAMHTQTLLENTRASLLVTQPEAGGDPLGASRVTLLGNVLPAQRIVAGACPSWNVTS